MVVHEEVTTASDLGEDTIDRVNQALKGYQEWETAQTDLIHSQKNPKRQLSKTEIVTTFQSHIELKEDGIVVVNKKTLLEENDALSSILLKDADGKFDIDDRAYLVVVKADGEPRLNKEGKIIITIALPGDLPKNLEENQIIRISKRSAEEIDQAPNHHKYKYEAVAKKPAPKKVSFAEPPVQAQSGPSRKM